MKKLALALFLLTAAGAVLWALGARRGAPAAGSTGLETVRVTRRDLERGVTATGVIKPRVGAEVRVGSRASGVVRRLFVRIGDTVRRGEVLAEIDTQELAARCAEAEAGVASARADLAYAASDLARKRRLANSLVVARNDLDLSERAGAVASERLKEAEAALETARTQLGYTRITAPIAGVVSSVSTQEGETVAASFASPTFVTLLDLDRLEVRAYVDETDIGRIHRGQAARFTVDTYPGREFAGEVVAVYPQAEIRDNVVNYITVLRFEPPRAETLRPEMTTTVHIALESRKDVLALPRRALHREDGRPYVLLRKGAGSERRWIKSGGGDEVYVEVVDGLREGDEVLLGDPQQEGKESAR